MLLYYIKDYYSFPSFTPRWGATDAEIKVPFVEKAELKGSPFKGLEYVNIKQYTLHLLTGISSLLISTALVHTPTFFQNFSRVIPMLLWLALVRVGPQDKIGHYAHCYNWCMQVPMLVPAEYKQAPKHVLLFSGCAFRYCGFNLGCGLRKGDLRYNDLWMIS